MRRFNVYPGADDTARRVLANGMTLVARPQDSSRTIAVMGRFPGGDVCNPRGKEGVNKLMASLLRDGSCHRNHLDIATFLESIGAMIAFSSTDHDVVLSLTCLAEDFAEVVSLAAELLREPSFPEDRFAIVRDQFSATVRYRLHDTRLMAQALFDRLYFGDHVYARDPVGSLESMANLTRADVVAQYGATVRPQGAILTVSGGLDPNDVFETLIREFEDWTVADDDATMRDGTSFPVAGAPLTAAREHYQIPGMSQSDFVVGFDGPEIFGEDYQAVRLGNCIFGQFGMMGRIGEVVREKNGLAYSISSSLRLRPLGRTWEIRAGVNPDNLQRALDLTMGEVRRYLSEPVTAEELADVKSYLSGVMPLALESNMGIADALMTIERYGLSPDYYREIGGQIAKITPEEIMAASRRYMNPERAVIADAGTASTS